MCGNISDIAAMGGRPERALVSIGVSPDESVERIIGIYTGIVEAAEEHRVKIIGGDTVRSEKMVVSIAIEGSVDEEALTGRDGASEGDILMVTGNLGASLAGLLLMQRGISGEPWSELLDRHLDPGCRADIGEDIGRIASAMMDISDGLVSDAGHISEMSGKALVIEPERVPLHPGLKDAAEILGRDPVEIALESGEEYELLFTVPQDRIDEALSFGTPIGHVESGSGVKVMGRSASGLSGWDHFL